MFPSSVSATWSNTKLTTRLIGFAIILVICLYYVTPSISIPRNDHWIGNTSSNNIKPSPLSSADKIEPWIRPPQDGVIDVSGFQERCVTGLGCLDWASTGLHSTDDLARTVATNPPEKYLIHTYWSGKPNRHIRALVLSFLYTQHLPTTQLWVWVYNLSEEEIEQELQSPLWRDLYPKLLNRVLFIPYDPNVQIPDDEARGFIHDHDPTAESDAVRFIVLWRYGGIYIDGDTLLFRDLRPWMNLPQEWAYYWGCEPYANTAVMGIQKGSSFARDLISFCVERDDVDCFHPHRITGFSEMKVSDREISIFPPELFDPTWKYWSLCAEWPSDSPPRRHFKEGMWGVYKEGVNYHKEHRTFFPGIYTNHYHLTKENVWDTQPENSWLAALEREWLRFAFEGTTNVYGEVLDDVLKDISEYPLTSSSSPTT